MIATWQVVGFFTYFEWEHYHIRKDIKCALKHSVPENQLKNFYFTNKEIINLTWIKSNEFKLNGRFYDVISKKKTKTGYHFKCVDDHQETELFQKLEESTVINLNNTSSSSPLKHRLKLLKTPFVFNVIGVKPIICSITKKESSNFKYHFSIKGIFQIPAYLPPKV
jgi:hypothetical protein